MLVVEKKRRFIKHRARAIVELSEKANDQHFLRYRVDEIRDDRSVSGKHGSHSNDRQYFFNPLKVIIFSFFILKNKI